MNQKKYAVLIALAMTVIAASLSGCGSVGSNSVGLEQNQAGKADVTITARFPSSGDATKSLIPSGTQVIEVSAMQPDSQGSPTIIATLTPAAATKTVKMAPGMYFIYATAFDSADISTRKILGHTSAGGEVVIGAVNNVSLTFLDGQWTLVNSNDSPSPLVLSNGTQLIDFIVGGSSQPMYKAGKSSIDYTKPVGGGGGMVRLRFENNTSARTYGWMASQFVGNSNSTLVNSDSYNLTKKCGYYNYYGLPCDEGAGDQIVMISGKDSGGSSVSGGFYTGDILYGSEYELLPGKGQTTFTQNGQPVDLMSAMPDTVVTGGNLITGGIVEWKPTTSRTTTLGTPSVAKIAKSATAIKAQSTNNGYPNLTVKNVETLVCSGANPQNRGTWSFANNSSAGKVVIGSKVCYTNYPYLSSQYDPILMQSVINAGDYSYGLIPADPANLGDYCHQWDYDMYLPYDPITNPSGTALNPNYNKACKQQLPGSGDVYVPWNFRALRTASKTTINYGSFKFNFWGETNQAGAAYIYPFRAKGSTSIKAAPAAPVITSLSVPASLPTGTTSSTFLTSSAYDPNGDSINWSWSIVSGGGALGAGCSGSGTSTVNSSCAYTPPATAASVVVRFTASDGVKNTIINRTLSVSDGTSVVIQ